MPHLGHRLLQRFRGDRWPARRKDVEGLAHLVLQRRRARVRAAHDVDKLLKRQLAEVGFEFGDHVEHLRLCHRDAKALEDGAHLLGLEEPVAVAIEGLKELPQLAQLLAAQCLAARLGLLFHHRYSG